MPKISVIVPIYKAEKYLGACVESICQQTFEDYELILVDDGSPDASGAMCDEFAAQYSRIKVIHQANQGVSAARNNGIKSAAGEWILFLDADDYLDADALESLDREPQHHQCDIMLFDAVQEFVDSKAFIRHEIDPGKIYDANDMETREWIYQSVMQPSTKRNKVSSAIKYCWNKLYRRSFLMENQVFFPEGIRKTEDKVFVLRCFEKHPKFCYFNRDIYHYRMNMESICNRYSASADRDRIDVVKLLDEIALRMDEEIRAEKKLDSYSKITKAYWRFLFGIISDVLLLQYFHPDCPDSWFVRRKKAIAFLKTEPFRTALKVCKYSELGLDAKVKKFLLSANMVTVFCAMKNGKSKKNVAQ